MSPVTETTQPPENASLSAAALAEVAMGPEMCAEFVGAMQEVDALLRAARAAASESDQARLFRKGLERLELVVQKFGPHLPTARNQLS